MSNEILHPDDDIDAGFHCIFPDTFSLVGLGINIGTSLTRTRKRARVIVHEDGLRAWGIWTPEEAIEAGNRLKIDKNTGNYADPECGPRKRCLQEKIGLL